ncbi:hypothetical protein [Gryllotalpicola koreensis]|uniref:Secreted peptide n=1 Tax=Gryllotalpicola koreensis TaxID=993086 RepID=A0ABP7ZRS3_9MICO
MPLVLVPVLSVVLVLSLPVPVVLPVSVEAEDVLDSWWRKTRPSAAVIPKATSPAPLTIAAAARFPRVRMSIGSPLSS